MRSVPAIYRKTSAVIFLVYCALTHPHPQARFCRSKEDARGVDRSAPDSTAAMKTETGSEGDGKDTGAPQQVDDAKEDDTDDDSGDDDEEFDPGSLYND